MFEQLAQYGSEGFFFLKFAIAIIFFYHGLPKIKNYKAMASAFGAPENAVRTLGFIETFGAVGMALGVTVTVSAFFFCLIMLGAIYKKTMTWKVSFIANDKTGWELDFILFFANLYVLLSGGYF